MRRTSLCILVGALGLASRANAIPLAITNAGFESPVLGCVAGVSCYTPTVDGWSAISVGVSVSVFKPGAGTFPGIPDGAQVLALGNASGAGSVTQTLAATLLDNTTYTLSVDVGRRADFPFSQYSIELLAGTNVLASATDGVSPGAGLFLTDTLVFNSGADNPFAGQALGIRLSATGRTATNVAAQADFDRVRLDGPVPEPSTLSLLALGAIGACSRLRRSVRR